MKSPDLNDRGVVLGSLSVLVKEVFDDFQSGDGSFDKDGCCDTNRNDTAGDKNHCQENA